ncbi:MAG TPA: hypothetical protein IAD26_02870 [Candidatus Limenecus avicola]|uniref:Uncharacterized protein n=1 Tax=Candidatus Limenecus avicola TaxID=2840847 RepID=A0A9D1MZJ8_9CLOT|nr:hypothetical protein [Candidatus Limenecus avicola]
MVSDKFIKNFAVSLTLVFVLSVAGFAADYVTTKLNEIEKNYYGYVTKGTVQTRLSRIERSLYGMNYKTADKTRVDKIYKDLNLGLNNSGPTGGAASAMQTQESQRADIGPKAEAGIKYPVVDKLEQKVFNKSYENDDIYARLSRLEKQTFKRESTLSLNERVDALRDKLLGGEARAAADIDPETEEIVLDNGKKYIEDRNYSDFGGVDDSHYNYYSYENSKNRIPETDTKNMHDDNSVVYAQDYDLDILEKQLFGKRFIQEPPSQRLARLENKVFQRTFNDNQEARTQRLLAVTTAQKTSKEYDSNKWAQRLNTGIQIGSILLMVLAMIL